MSLGLGCTLNVWDNAMYVYVLSQYNVHGKAYLPIAVYRTMGEAESFVKSVGGRWASLAKYPNDRTYCLNILWLKEEDDELGV